MHEIYTKHVFFAAAAQQHNLLQIYIHENQTKHVSFAELHKTKMASALNRSKEKEASKYPSSTLTSTAKFLVELHIS